MNRWRPRLSPSAPRSGGKHYSPCPPPNQCDTIPPIIIIVPAGGLYTPPQDSVSLTIYYCGFKNLNDTTHYVNYYTEQLAGQFTFTTETQDPNCPVSQRTSDAVATGTIHLIEGHRGLAAGICTPGPDGVCGYTQVYFDFHPKHGVSVLTNSAIAVNPNAHGSASFTVTNEGQRLDTIVVTPTCSGPGLSCTSTPDSLHLAAGASQVVSFAYNTTGGLVKRIPGPTGGKGGSKIKGPSPQLNPASYAPGSVSFYGSMSVGAYDIYNSEYRDSAYTDLYNGVINPGVDVVSMNPGNQRDRDLCLTFAIAPGAAYQCGDLRITHALPAVRIYNRVHAPTLIYTSELAHPHPVVSALVTLSAGDKNVYGSPDTVVASLYSGSTLFDYIRYSGAVAAGFASSNGDTTLQIAMTYDGLGNGTALQGYTLGVTAIYNNAHVDTTYTTTGTLGYVGAQWSKYGAGWLVAGLEGLKNYGSTGLFWTSADGSFALYTPVSSSSWVAARQTDRPDTIKLVSVNGTNYYIRYAEHGTQVWFNGSTLVQSLVVDRLKDTTYFTYGSNSNLTALTFSSPKGPVTYTFNYNGSGYLASITAPPDGSTARVVTINSNSSHQITSIKDPDGNSVSFQYVSEGYTNVIGALTDRRGTTTRFVFDPGYRLDSAVVDTGSSHLNIRTAFSAEETAGLLAPVSLANAFTEVNGPRTDTTITKFWLDGLGEPLQIQDAMGRWTLISRSNTKYPALVTRIKHKNQRVVTETYDGRGNPATETDSSISIGGKYPTDTFAFDQKWDYVNHITRAMGEQWWAQYDTGTGNRQWEQVGPLTDSTRRVHYGYNGIHLLASTSVPLTRRDSILYDSTGLGNVIAHRTPGNYWTYTARDAIGRDSVDLAPIDSSDHTVTGTGHNRVRHRAVYDIMDRVIVDTTIGVGVSISTNKFSGSIPAETLYVWRYYNPTNALDSVLRRAGPDTNHIKTQKTSYTRDGIDRVVKEYYPEPDSLIVFDYYSYDAASNVILRQDRNGAQVKQSYDPMNRVAQRTIPQENQGFVTWGSNTFPSYPNAGSSYDLWADTATFAYDLVGNLQWATNHDAVVARQYDPRGLILVDSLYLRTYEQIDSGGSYSHKYSVTNTYDLEGRRTQLTYPYYQTLAATFGYDPVTGLLASTTGPDSTTSVVTFSTDAALRNYLTTYPGGVTEQLFFDSAGRVQRRLHTGTASGTFHSDTMWYDAAGRVLQADQIAIRTRNTYATLGPLIATETIDSTRPTVPGYTTEAHESDAFGNEFATFATSPPPTGAYLIPQTYRTYYYYPYEARVGKVWQGCGGFITPNQSDESDVSDTTSFLSDGSEASAMWQNATSACLNPDSSIAEYRIAMDGGDGKLRVTDMHSTQPSTASASDFEEFWYDALGRRVYRRSRRPSSTPNCEQTNVCHSVIQRFIWDGDQVLAELQALDTGGDTTTATLENEAGFGKYAGVVFYVHANGIDAPVEVVKLGAEQPFNDVAFFPHANWRGLPDLATYTNGQTSLVSGTDSFTVAWPAQSMLQSYQQRYQTGDQEWVGSLTTQQRDPTGALYMRNRYYDSQTGRFTQEDPLGLDGGLNAYGFAGGDPVDYSDPFGLCPVWKDGKPCNVSFVGLNVSAGWLTWVGSASAGEYADESRDVGGYYVTTATGGGVGSIPNPVKKVKTWLPWASVSVEWGGSESINSFTGPSEVVQAQGNAGAYTGGGALTSNASGGGYSINLGLGIVFNKSGTAASGSGGYESNTRKFGEHKLQHAPAPPRRVQADATATTTQTH